MVGLHIEHTITQQQNNTNSDFPGIAGFTTKVITINGSHMKTNTNISLKKYKAKFLRLPTGGTIPLYKMFPHDQRTYTSGISMNNGTKANQKNHVEASRFRFEVC